MTQPGCIDVHTHVVPEYFPAYMGCNVGVPWPSMTPVCNCHSNVLISGKHYRTVNDGAWSTDRRLQDMDRMGVGLQVLSPMPELLSYWLPPEDAQTLVRHVNDRIADMVSQEPARFVALGGVVLQDLDRAIAELSYLKRNLGFAGVEIASHVNGISIGDHRFAPFFEAAESLGAAVFVHALHPSGQDRLVGSFAEQAVCYPGDIALAAASMITGGMASKYPALRVAFSHGGGALAMLLPRLVQHWKTSDKARYSLDESPAACAARFFYDSLTFDPGALDFIVSTFGSSQIFVGSDYPFGMSDKNPVGSLSAAGFDSKTDQALRHDNARRFLDLPMTAST